MVRKYLFCDSNLFRFTETGFIAPIWSILTNVNFLDTCFALIENERFLSGGGVFFQCQIVHWLIRSCSVTKSCLTPCNPIDCSPPVSSFHGIFPARILEWVASSSSRRSSWPKDQTFVSCFSCIAGGFFTTSAIWEELPTS